MVQSILSSVNYSITHSNGRHTFYADEPESIGGKDTAPSPDELLEAALASCTMVTLRMYTNHKKWNVGDISITVSLQREKENTIITRELNFEQELSQEQKERLMQVAKSCPVSKTLSAANNLQVKIK
jgi:putative redox protein